MSKVFDVTVGKHDSSVTYLTTPDFKVLEYPSSLLPDDIKTGSVLQIKVDFNDELCQKTSDHFMDFQNSLLQKIKTFTPKAPVLSVKSRLPTSIIVTWEPFSLGVSKLKNVSLWHKTLDKPLSNSSETLDQDGVFVDDVSENDLVQIATIYSLTNRTYQLSGLNNNSKHAFQLRIDTSNGTYCSELLVAETLSSNDLSGFSVCIGALSTGQVTVEDIKAVADALHIKNISRDCTYETTHFLTDTVDDENEEHDLQLKTAKKLNIPIVTPNWLQGCLSEKKLLGVKGFYYKLGRDDKSNLSAKYPFSPGFTAGYCSKQAEQAEKEEAVEEREEVLEQTTKEDAEQDEIEVLEEQEEVLEQKEEGVSDQNAENAVEQAESEALEEKEDGDLEQSTKDAQEQSEIEAIEEKEDGDLDHNAENALEHTTKDTEEQTEIKLIEPTESAALEEKDTEATVEQLPGSAPAEEGSPNTDALAACASNSREVTPEEQLSAGSQDTPQTLTSLSPAQSKTSRSSKKSKKKGRRK